jgi:DNA invertase Pin-like site-specific DNA recombinase
LAFIQADKADVLMTWESSRASRGLSTFLPLHEALINRRMTWTTADDSFARSRASDRKRISHEVVDNEHESGRTSERVQRSVRANAAKGRPHGRHRSGDHRWAELRAAHPLQERLVPRNDDAVTRPGRSNPAGDGGRLGKPWRQERTARSGDGEEVSARDADV